MDSETYQHMVKEILAGVKFENSTFAENPDKYKKLYNSMKKEIDETDGIVDIPFDMVGF